jgi:hypothetical protein
LVVAVLAAAAVVGTAGCAVLSGNASQADAADGPLTVVLFDVSRSTDDPAIRERYAEAFDRVLQATAASQGTLVADVIDDNPLAHASYPIDVTFAPCDPLTENRLTCEARAAESIQEATGVSREILGGPSGPAGTDIRAGVALAARVFGAYPAASERSLVVLSDMVEHAPARAEDPPSLGGVRVYVVGAGVVANGSLPARRILAIERTWRRFFAAAGADLSVERYGAALVRFP